MERERNTKELEETDVVQLGRLIERFVSVLSLCTDAEICIIKKTYGAKPRSASPLSRLILY